MHFRPRKERVQYKEKEHKARQSKGLKGKLQEMYQLLRRKNNG